MLCMIRKVEVDSNIKYLPLLVCNVGMGEQKNLYIFEVQKNLIIIKIPFLSFFEFFSFLCTI